MNRRKLLTGLSATSIIGIAGCTMTSQRGTSNNTAIESEYYVDDGILHINGNVGFDCHSGFTEAILVNIAITLDNKTINEQKEVETYSCGNMYNFSHIERVGGDWNEIQVDVEVIERL